MTRLQICKQCTHATEFKRLISCGTFLIGNTIVENEKVVHLCGCVMNVKTKIKSSKCPLGKW